MKRCPFQLALLALMSAGTAAFSVTAQPLHTATARFAGTRANSPSLVAIPPAEVLLATTSQLALFGWPTYESAQGYTSESTFAGHGGDLTTLAILTIVFPTVITFFFLKSRDD